MMKPNFMEKLLDGVDVEWKPLEAVIKSLKTGLNPRKNFQLNTPDSNGFYVTVREIQNGKITFLDKTDRVDNRALELINNRSNLESGDVLFSGTGTVGRTAVIETTPINWNIKEGVYVIKPIQEIISSKYLCHLINSQDIIKTYSRKIVGSPVMSLPMSDLKKLKIPIPCPDKQEKSLEIQEEIVRILDTFTELIAELTAELTAELKARKKQYTYYRDKLIINANSKVEKLEDIANIYLGLTYTPNYVDNGIKFISAKDTSGDFLDLTNVKYISEVEYKKSTSNAKPKRGDVLFTRVGSNLGHPVIVETDEELCIFVSLGFIRVNPNKVLNSYIKHWMNTDLFWDQVKKNVYGSAKVNLNTGWLKKFDVLLPDLEDQARIVSILDKFDELTSSITEGLPREIELRQKQYEYYRNMLLSFPKEEV